jgi:hypothetical protein
LKYNAVKAYFVKSTGGVRWPIATQRVEIDRVEVNVRGRGSLVESLTLAGFRQRGAVANDLGAVLYL